MLAAGFLIIFAGYTVGSWGMCLLKGYDITFTEWVNPLHPFQWSTVTLLPDNVILPGGAVKTGGGGGSAPPGLAGPAAGAAIGAGNNIPSPNTPGNPGPGGPVFGGPR